MTKGSEQVVGYIARRVAGSCALERWALYRTDKTLSNTFGAEETRDDVAAALAQAGFVLRDDNTVARA